MKKTHNVLVTGVGAIIGYGIVESLRLANIDCKVTGVDVFKENYGKYVCDDFFEVPYTNDPDYENVLSKIINDNKIDILFPGIEQDLYYFIDNKHLFATKIVLNNEKLVHLSKDKWNMYQYLNEQKFQHLIPTYTELNYDSALDKIGLPFIIKPKSSYASKGFYIIENETDFIKISEEVNQDTLFQSLKGAIDEEYTISVFGNGYGNYYDSLILRRYLSKAGASEKVFVIKKDNELMKAVTDLVEIFKPIGPTNFQFRKEGKEVYLLEINPRISSACSLRTKFGYNDALYCFQYYLENKEIMVEEKKYGKAIRYIADKIIYE